MLSIAVDNLDRSDEPLLQSMLAEAGLPPAEVGHPNARFWKFNPPNGGIAGFAGLEFYGPAALLRSVVVGPKQRGHGLGRIAVEAVLAHAAAAGVSAVYLLTTTAADFFARLGFEVTDRNGVPPAIARTGEFTTLCPSTAVCMVKRIPPFA